MLKRHLHVENKENQLEQSSLSFIGSSSIAKSTNDENKINLTKKMKTVDANNARQSKTSADKEETDDEDREPWSIGLVIKSNNGTTHPTNKQYILYDNTEPNMISKTARFWSLKYLKVLEHVNPDSYDMYIHKDFACYGELEVIENCLTDIARKIFHKRKGQLNFSHCILAFRRLEALTIVLDNTHYFVSIDDVNRFHEIIRVIGACYVTILRSLLPTAILIDNEELNSNDMKKLHKISQQLPNFKQVLKRVLMFGHIILSIGSMSSAYTNILQTIYCNWSFVMDKVRIDPNEKSDKKYRILYEALKHASEIKKNTYKESFNFIEEFDLYSKNNPGLGGNSHDLRKWSQTQRNLYKYDNTDNDSFWFRL